MPEWNVPSLSETDLSETKCHTRHKSGLDNHRPPYLNLAFQLTALSFLIREVLLSKLARRPAILTEDFTLQANAVLVAKIRQ
jgi:hypothetical protein